jgi:hypothetical protein
MDIEHTENERELDLSEVERRLAAWRPASGGLDRDRMLYEAGRAAARADGRIHSWRLATAALTLLTVSLGGLLARERAQRRELETSVSIASRIKPSRPVGEVALPAPREDTAIEPFAPSSYFALTTQVARSIPEIASMDAEFDPKTRRPSAVNPSERIPQRRPLQPRDLPRVLDL